MSERITALMQEETERLPEGDFEREPDFREPPMGRFFSDGELAEMWKECQEFVEDETKWP